MTSYRLEMIPGYTMDIDLSRVFAVFGDHKIDRASVAAACGTNSSEGCPLDESDRKLIGEKPGVHDTMLPSKTFEITNRRGIRVKSGDEG